MNDTTYNGWTNRATWNVMLWLNNDEGLYRLYSGRSIPWTAESAEKFCNEMFATGRTPDNLPLSQVNWQEIADGMNEE